MTTFYRKTVKSMNRLYAVPSEKMRVWSVWLSKVEEKAIEWHRWICAHLNLMLRMSRILRQAENAIRQVNNDNYDDRNAHKWVGNVNKQNRVEFK